MLVANFDANGTVIMTSSNCATINGLVSIMKSGDKTGFVVRLKKPVFSRHGRIFSRQEHVSPADEVGPDNNGMMMIAFITFKSSLVPLLEGL